MSQPGPEPRLAPIADNKKVDTSKIPETLKLVNNWVNWKLEERDGELTKVPKNPLTGKNAKSDDSGTWGTFEEALEAAQYFKCIIPYQ